MAKYFATVVKPQQRVTFLLPEVQGRFLHITPALMRVKAGKIKVSQHHNKPVNFEDSLSPPHIGHRKSWNSWNTSTIEGGHRPSEILIDDLFIRKFIEGAFPGRLMSKVIIKRQFNIIRIAAIFKPMVPPSRMCFMIGFTEELLSRWFQSIVKMEVHIVRDPKDMIFKYI